MPDSCAVIRETNGEQLSEHLRESRLAETNSDFKVQPQLKRIQFSDIGFERVSLLERIQF